MSKSRNSNIYVVATIKPWNIDAFHIRAASLPGEWRLIGDLGELTLATLTLLKPRYVFFPHWSWTVPPDILDAVECVCFHMTDVPYGRGGSPLQNLIVRGHQETMVSVLRMVEEIDAGPVYLKEPLSLEGSAREIYKRLADLVYDMIEEIITTEPQPVPQEGEIVTFTRRSPAQSLLPEATEINELYDHIRMLDAETYPRAFIEHGGSRLEFSDASLDGDGVLRARVEFIKTAKESK